MASESTVCPQREVSESAVRGVGKPHEEGGWGGRAYWCSRELEMRSQQCGSVGGNAFQVEGIAGAKALRQPPTGHAPEMQSMVSVAGIEGRRWEREARGTPGSLGSIPNQGEANRQCR